MFVTAVKIIAVVIGFIALFLTFKTKYVIENLLHREATEKAVLRVKYIALGLAVIAFLGVFLLGNR